MKRIPQKMTRLPALALALLALALPALCNVPGSLRVRSNNATYQGTIRWKGTEKKYEITTTDGRTFSFSANDVQIIIPRPPALDKALVDLREGKFASVVSGLNPILQNYINFPFDEEIASTLANAYLGQKNAEEAVKVCERIANPNARPEAAYKGGMVSAYWNALLTLNRVEKLNDLLEKAIKTGDIPAMAQAAVLRGDMLLRVANPTGNDYRNALVDGYLRVIVLYPREARDVLPEALFKAAQCFDKMGQSVRAQTFRNQLADQFPESVWANK